jgi:hypothetical protein
MAKTPALDYLSIRKHCDQRRAEMELDFDQIRPHLLEIARNCYYPAIKGLDQKYDSTSDSGTESSQADTDMLNNHPAMCLRRGAAGFHANLTSPSRQWFRIGASGQDNKNSSVRTMMDERTSVITDIIRRSGAYKEFHVMYTHLLFAGFGTLVVTDDPARVIKPICLRMGTYAVANGPDGKINRLVRRFSYTGHKLLQEFGNELSDEMKQKITGRLKERFLICNLIEPDRYNEIKADDLTAKLRLFKGFNYRSIYWIEGLKDEREGIIRVSGYERNPIICCRMDREYGDVYGLGRGHEALPMMKGLQAVVYDSLQMSSHAAEPPVQASSDYATTSINLDRGGVNVAGPSNGEDSYIRKIDLGAPDAVKICEYNQGKLEDAIAKAFYNDIFSAISMVDRGKMTAAEVYQRTGESLLMLGPVLSSIDDEFLDPFINLVSHYALKAGKIEQPIDQAQEISNTAIEYISSVHLAQKASELGVIDRFVSFSANLASVRPETLDNLDADATQRLYGDMLGVPEVCLVNKDTVKSSRAKRASAAAAQMQQEQQLKATETMAKVGAVPTQGTVAGALAGVGM